MKAALKDARYTYADYCAWDDGERWELIGGKAYSMAPAPTTGHQGVQAELLSQLRVFLRGKKCRAFGAPVDVRLNAEGGDDTVVQPDILVVCDPSKLEDKKSVIGAPDLIIEILSPSTERHDRGVKFELYQKSGVHEYWIVDPRSKMVFVHLLHEGKYITQPYYDNGNVPVETLEGCMIDLAYVFEEN